MICIFGAGAIGGLMAAKLAAKGEVDVTVIARGPHLAAMQANGLKLICGRARRQSCIRAASPAPPRPGRRTTSSSP